jgi:acyl-coenzyme A thioesterase PaaI-like protein
VSATDEDIVAAIRELARVAHGFSAPTAGRDDALDHIEAARALLAAGEARPRGYEEAAGQSGTPRSRNRELSAFSGSLNPVAPPMTIRTAELDDGRLALIGSVRLDRLREGPPRAAHGGVLAGLFDELLGGGQRLNGGPPGMTGRLTVRYRRPTPLDAELEMRAWIHDERTHRVTVRGDCVVVGDRDRRVTADAEAVFLRVDFERLSDMMRTRAEGDPPAAAPPRSRDE